MTVDTDERGASKTEIRNNAEARIESPNIIFVFSDQQRYSSLASSGNKVIKTPNFDRLAAEGAFFEQAFSSCPICSPYRGQLLTGRYAHKDGVVDNEYRLYDGQMTLPQVMKNAGYHTGFIGKWHLGYGPYTAEKRYGFDYMAAHNANHDYYHLKYHENESGPFNIDEWGPKGETELAIRFIDRHLNTDPDTPFLLMLAWGPPHWPYEQYPQEYNDYDPQEIDLPSNVPVQMAAFARQEIANYYGNITALDHEMGRLLRFLDEKRLEQHTILCFSSDHGDHLSSHGYGKPMDRWLHHSKRASKATPHEESIHVPLLLRYPALVNPGQRVKTMFSSVDTMPTLLGLAGLETPDGVQGSDLSRSVLGIDDHSPDSVYLQILGPGWPQRGEWVGYWRGVRTRSWVYARWIDNDCGPWLFDRVDDPLEMNNLAGDPEYGEIQAAMESRLREWLTETDDPFETGVRDPETGMLCLGQEFTHERWKGY